MPRVAKAVSKDPKPESTADHGSEGTFLPDLRGTYTFVTADRDSPLLNAKPHRRP